MDSTNAVPRSTDPAAALAAWSTHVLAGLLGLTAAVFVGRRLAGALVEPLSLPVLLGVTLIVSVVAIVARRAWRSQADSSPRCQLLQIGTTAAVLGLAVALSLPGTSILGLVALWTILGMEETWTWWRHPGHGSPSPSQTVPRPRSSATATGAPTEPDPSTPLAKLPELPVPPAGGILQQMVRTALPDGGERLTGWLRAPLAAGQRTANLHVAFCPPFPQIPRVTADQRDGPAARIKLVQLLPFGARFDVKLIQPSDAASAVLLYVRAEWAPPVSDTSGGSTRETKPEESS